MITKSLLTAVVALLTTTLVMSQPTPPNGKKWEKVDRLSDEFNGGFDQGKWEKVLWDYPNTPTAMIAENSGVSGGNLWIKATLDNNSQRWFQSSRVYSVDQIKYPMYTECSMITAHLSAYNTFWLNNGDINDRDEIDVVENNSRPSCCQPNFPWQMNSQYFQATNGNTVRNAGNFDNRNLSPNNPKRGVKWNEGYHTVGVWWKDARNIQFYLDGEPAGRVTTARDLTRNLNLIWDLWTADESFLGGLAVRSHLTNNNINTMKVDWVHTYKLVDDPNGGGGGGNGPNPSDAYRIVSVKSSKWVSPINGTAANGARIVNHPNRNGDARLWRFVDRGDGYTEVKNVRSERCLAVPGGNTANGVGLVQWDCRGYQDQQWKRVARDNGQFSFVNRKTGKCLDLAGGNTANNVQFHQWECNANNINQRFWILSPNAGNRIQLGKEDEKGLSIYPNPANNILQVSGISDVEKIQLINLQGKVILEQNVSSQDAEAVLNIESLNSGIYLLKVDNTTYRFIKE